MLIADQGRGAVFEFPGGRSYRLPTGYISSLTASPDGQCWVTEPAMNGIFEFPLDRHKSIGRQISLPASAVRILSIPNGIAAIDLARNKLFAVCSGGGKAERSFGSFVHDEAELGPALDGSLAFDPKADDIIYVPFYYPLFVEISPAGRVRLVRSAVVGSFIPRVLVTSLNRRRVIQPSGPVALSVAVDSGDIFILSQGSPANHDLAIDTYRESSGGYRYSIHAPAQTFAIVVHGDTLWTLDRSKLTEWKWSRPAREASSK